MNNYTITPFLRGRVKIYQPIKGLRFSIDSVILAGFSHIKDGETVIDLGCGSGIIMVLLREFYHPSRVDGIEIQDELFELANLTIKENGIENSTIIKGDFTKIQPKEKYDVVVSNPPYFESHEGKVSPILQKEISYHRKELDLEKFFNCVKSFLKDDGRFYFIMSSKMKERVLKSLCEVKLYPYMIREVKYSQKHKPKRFLAICSLKEKNMITLDALLIKKDNGEYTEELKRYLGEIPFKDEPSFFCDAMLHRLMRYLRFFGIDTAYIKGVDDEFILRESLRSGRVLLTLDNELLNRAKKVGVKCYKPSSLNPKEQFIEVVNIFNLNRKNARCLLCNREVLKVDKNEVKEVVPYFIYKTKEDFYICPVCGKITWMGTHLERFESEIVGGINIK